MLRYSIVFLLLAVISLALGFWIAAGIAATLARLLVVVFVVLFALSLWKRQRD